MTYQAILGISGTELAISKSTRFRSIVSINGLRKHMTSVQDLFSEKPIESAIVESIAIEGPTLVVLEHLLDNSSQSNELVVHKLDRGYWRLYERVPIGRINTEHFSPTHEYINMRRGKIAVPRCGSGSCYIRILEDRVLMAVMQERSESQPRMTRSQSVRAGIRLERDNDSGEVVNVSAPLISLPPEGTDALYGGNGARLAPIMEDPSSEASTLDNDSLMSGSIPCEACDPPGSPDNPPVSSSSTTSPSYVAVIRAGNAVTGAPISPPNPVTPLASLSKPSAQLRL